MKFVNFATSNHVGLENLTLSLSKQTGWEHVVLGKGEKWQGFTSKMKHYMNFCLRLTDLADAYDVLCLRSQDDFLELYNKHAKDKIVLVQKIYVVEIVPNQ